MQSRKMSRRRFIKRSSAAALATTGLLSSSTISSLAGDEPPPPAGSRNVAIIVDPADPVASSPPAKWAIAQLTDVLKSKNLAVRLYPKIADAKPNEFCIVAAGVKSPSLEKLIGASGMKIPETPDRHDQDEQRDLSQEHPAEKGLSQGSEPVETAGPTFGNSATTTAAVTRASAAHGNHPHRSRRSGDSRGSSSAVP